MKEGSGDSLGNKLVLVIVFLSVETKLKLEAGEKLWAINFSPSQTPQRFACYRPVIQYRREEQETRI